MGQESEGKFFGARSLEAGGRTEANRAAMRDEYDWAQKYARESASQAEDFLLSEAMGNPPRPDSKWHRSRLREYMYELGSPSGGAIVMPYKPRKYPPVKFYAGMYEEQKGQKVPKGTKWLTWTVLRGSRGGFGSVKISAHKTIASAKAAGARTIKAVKNTKKRKR
jgi:hypothetical protein